MWRRSGGTRGRTRARKSEISRPRRYSPIAIAPHIRYGLTAIARERVRDEFGCSCRCARSLGLAHDDNRPRLRPADRRHRRPDWSGRRRISPTDTRCPDRLHRARGRADESNPQPRHLGDGADRALAHRLACRRRRFCPGRDRARDWRRHGRMVRRAAAVARYRSPA